MVHKNTNFNPLERRETPEASQCPFYRFHKREKREKNEFNLKERKRKERKTSAISEKNFSTPK